MNNRLLIASLAAVWLAGCASEPTNTPDAAVSSLNPTESPTVTEPTPTPRSQPNAAERSPSPGGSAGNEEQAQDLPTANASGDYTQRTQHRTWTVVDADPSGLNCRWSDQMPADWYSPSAQLPPLTIEQWPVVRQFRQGETLTANITPAGFAMLVDDKDQLWLKVSLGAQDQICLVRANAQYIKPVQQ